MEAKPMFETSTKKLRNKSTNSFYNDNSPYGEQMITSVPQKSELELKAFQEDDTNDRYRLSLLDKLKAM